MGWVLVVQPYQPESRSWRLQAVEATIFVAPALLIRLIAYGSSLESHSVKTDPPTFS